MAVKLALLSACSLASADCNAVNSVLICVRLPSMLTSAFVTLYEGAVVEVYENVDEPVAPNESVAVMVYVPVTQADDPPVAVLYEKVPPVPTVALSESTGVPDGLFTWMKTWSDWVGAGDTVPEIV